MPTLAPTCMLSSHMQIHTKIFRINSFKRGQAGHRAGVGMGTVAARDGLDDGWMLLKVGQSIWLACE